MHIHVHVRRYLFTWSGLIISRSGIERYHDKLCTRALVQRYGSQREKMYLITCTPNEDPNQSAHLRSLNSLRCPHEETLHPWLSKMRPVKILIRLHECAVWSESSLDAHVQWYVFFTYGSYDIKTYISDLCYHQHDKISTCTTKYTVFTLNIRWLQLPHTCPMSRICTGNCSGKSVN